MNGFFAFYGILPFLLLDLVNRIRYKSAKFTKKVPSLDDREG